MIVVVGSPEEPPVSRVVDEAESLGVETVVLAQEAEADWDIEVAADGVRVSTLAGAVDLADATGLYLRLTSPRLAGPRPEAARTERRAAAVRQVAAWADIAPCRVANRPTAMLTSGSQPHQAALARECGLSVPDTLVTSDPEAVRRFLEHHGRVVYTSTTGTRSITHELTPARLVELQRVGTMPTLFQQLVQGTNVRVHVIGRDVYAVATDARSVDHRYAGGGRTPSMRPTVLPDAVGEACVRLSRGLELPLAGIDLMRDLDGGWWCFEVNPSPAYTSYEKPTGVPIARSLASWLAGLDAA